MGKIASGISEALITTETGLVIALPGVFYQYATSRRLQRYKAFLAHLETVCTQTVHRRLAMQLKRVATARAKRQVASEIAQQLRAQGGSR